MHKFATTEYPPRQYLYKKQANPVVEPICRVLSLHQAALAEIRSTPFRKSIEVERVIAADLEQLGFWHSVNNQRYAPLFKKGLNFEVDFYHPALQVAIEVEKGEINNIWKNICKFSESAVIRHGVIMVPVIRQGQQTTSEFYNNTIKRLANVERIFSLIDSLVVIGY